MYFNLDLIRRRLFVRRDLIANDFGVGRPTTQRAVTTDFVSR